MKRKLARIYVVFNFKKLQSHSKNKINKWEENGHVLKQKNAFQFFRYKKI